MRLIIARADENGRSCVTENRTIDVSVWHEVDVVLLAETASAPPQAAPAAAGTHLDNAPPAGILQWKLARFPPYHHYPTHHTDSIDFHSIVDGSITLGLDDGSHPLRAGDCVMVAGCGHEWTVGAEGCALLMARIGTTAS